MKKQIFLSLMAILLLATPYTFSMGAGAGAGAGAAGAAAADDVTAVAAQIHRDPNQYLETAKLNDLLTGLTQGQRTQLANILARETNYEELKRDQMDALQDMRMATDDFRRQLARRKYDAKTRALDRINDYNQLVQRIRATIEN